MTNIDDNKPETDLSGKATNSLILGIIGLIAWVIPIIGLPIQVTGLVFGILSRNSVKGGSAIAGIILSIIGLILSILNAVWGAYLASTGQYEYPW